MKGHSPESKKVRSVPVDDLIYPSMDYSHIQSFIWTEALYERLVNGIRRQELAWRKSGITEDRVTQPNVRYLYRYRSVDSANPEWTEASFAEKKLWASSIDKLNDPLEAAFVLQREFPDPWTAEAVKMLLTSNWYGCICFSIDPVCPQMWAHYAAEHSGFCIKYSLFDSFLLWSNCHPVVYRRTMPAIGEAHDIPDLIKSFGLSRRIGSTKWSGALRYPRANAYTAPGLLVPSGVIFGLRTNDQTKAFLRKCAVGVSVRPGRTNTRAIQTPDQLGET